MLFSYALRGFEDGWTSLGKMDFACKLKSPTVSYLTSSASFALEKTSGTITPLNKKIETRHYYHLPVTLCVKILMQYPVGWDTKTQKSSTTAAGWWWWPFHFFVCVSRALPIFRSRKIYTNSGLTARRQWMLLFFKDVGNPSRWRKVSSWMWMI